MTGQRKGFQPHCDSDAKANTNTVKIANLPNHVNRGEVVALFSTLIGDIRSTSEFRDAVGTHVEITFLAHDAAKKALCMSGYTIGGCSLVVTPVTHVDDAPLKRPDHRRNLYVLGIPFDLTKGEFASIFSRFGQVSHCVILATVDNASRRRGFVVMANHEDAKRAMMALTRTQIKGHTIDVSWSIVQRSEGFLDGGDRTMVFESHPSSPESQDDNCVFPASDSSNTVASSPPEKSFTLTFSPSTALLVTNLPFILFADTSDLEPLVVPFGTIKKLEMIAFPSPQETTSALVEYDSVESAKDAKDSLQGQCYAKYRINAEYVVFPDASPTMPEVPDFSDFDFDVKFQNDRSSSRTDFCTMSAPPSRNQSRNHSHNVFQPKRALQDISNSSNYPHHYLAPPSVASYAPKSGPMIRSSSANSRWSNDSSQCYPSRNSYSYPNQMPSNSYKVQNRVVYTPVYH